MASASINQAPGRKTSGKRDPSSADKSDSTNLPSSGGTRRVLPCCVEKAETISGNHDLLPSASAYNVSYGDIANSKKGFSIYRRYEVHPDETPSPVDYTNTKEFGNFGPKYSLGSKLIQYADECPGPGSYCPHWEASATWKDAPAYSLRARMGPVVFPTLAVNGSNDSPGAQAYFPAPEKVEVGATLKGRHKDAKIIKTPGPGSYIISAETLSGPQFTMVPRDEYDPEGNPSYRPGPASYETSSNAIMELSYIKSPKFTLTPRNIISSPPTPSPGPVYLPTIYTVSRNCSPKIALKSRHEPVELKNIANAPGPADYSPIFEAKRPEAEKGIKSAADDPQRQLTVKFEKQILPYPGPADYDSTRAITKTLSRAPAFSLGARQRTCFGELIQLVAKEADTPATQNKVTQRAASSGMAKEVKISKEKKIKFSLEKKEKPQSSSRPSSYSASSSLSPRAASMKGRQSDAVLVFPTMRFDTLRV